MSASTIGNGPKSERDNNKEKQIERSSEGKLGVSFPFSRSVPSETCDQLDRRNLFSLSQSGLIEIDLDNATSAIAISAVEVTFK